jgi:rhamnosyl/mannosyltransferase
MVGKFYFPSVGGIETVLRNLSEGLLEAGDTVTVLCSTEGHAGADEWIGGVRVLRATRLGSFASQPLTPTLLLRLRSLAREHDVVHLHSPNPLAEAAALALPPRVRVVVSHHSDIIRQRWALPLYAPMQELFLRRVSRVVVATEAHIDHSPVLPRFRAKCEVIPYGLDPAVFVPTPALEARAAELRAKEGPYALFVGRLVGYKGVEHLLAAMPEVPGKLVIVGTGPLRGELEAQARALGVAGKVRFAGRVSDDAELGAYFRGASALVLPSVTRAEAFGLVQVEAMAWERPSIYTRLDSGVTLVSEAGVTGLDVPVGDARALAGALRRLLTEPGLSARMGAAARARFEARFTRARMVEAYRGVYASIRP